MIGSHKQHGCQCMFCENDVPAFFIPLHLQVQGWGSIPKEPREVNSWKINSATIVELMPDLKPRRLRAFFYPFIFCCVKRKCILVINMSRLLQLSVFFMVMLCYSRFTPKFQWVWHNKKLMYCTHIKLRKVVLGGGRILPSVDWGTNSHRKLARGVPFSTNAKEARQHRLVSMSIEVCGTGPP